MESKRKGERKNGEHTHHTAKTAIENPNDPFSFTLTAAGSVGASWWVEYEGGLNEGAVPVQAHARSETTELRCSLYI